MEDSHIPVGAVSASATPEASAVSVYEGVGIKALRVEGAGGRDSSAVIQLEAGKVFGGDTADPQDWTILQGEGLLSWSSPFRRVRVRAGQTFRMGLGERLLLKAETRLWLQLSRPSPK